MPLAGGRRALHQTLFSFYSASPPAQPPAGPTQPPSYPFPKHPSSSSSSSSSSDNRPFFPLYPSPPPPRSVPSLPTFPANISSLITPSHNAPHSSKLIPIICLPIIGLALLCLIAAFVHSRRKRSYGKGDEPPSDASRLVPPDATPSSEARKLSATSAPASSEFLYLGTLVSSRGHVAGGPSSGEVGPALAAESPELRPLPPLSRHARRSFSSDEEFYSPKAERSPGGGRKEKCGSQSPVSSLSSPSYSPPSFKPPAPPPPPPPPKGKFDFSNKNGTFSVKDEQSQPFLAKTEEFSGTPIASSPPRRQAPPPPPLEPPVLAPPKTVVVLSEESPHDSGEEGRCEGQRRPKLKPLHWDKVRASSDRTMVWDHLKSSSFQWGD